MSGVKISALPAANAANDTDQMEVNQSGTSRRVTVGQIVSRVSRGVSVGDFIPPSLVGTSTDVLAYLQAAADAAEASGQTLLFPPGTYTTFGELHINNTSVIFAPGATIRVTRDDLCGLLVQGNNLVIQNPRIIGVYATPATSGNPAGSRIKRNGSVAPWNAFPYNQGGVARCPFRDRNAGIIAINADDLTIENADIENFNIGIHARGSYAATNAVPAPATAYDWQIGGGYAPGAGTAPISWPPGLQNDSNGDVGYMTGLRILHPRFSGCDMGMMLTNHIGYEVVDPVNQDTTLIQNSPPHMIYSNSSDGYNYPNRNCKVRGGSDTNNIWSHSVKFEFHQRLLVDGLEVDGAFGGVIASDCDDSTFSNINARNLATPFAPLTGSWLAGSDTVTLSSTAQAQVGFFLSSATYGLPRPCEITEVIDATHVRIELLPDTASGGTVTIWLTTNSSSSTLVANFGSRRAAFDRISGASIPGENDTYGIFSRASPNRVLTRYAYSTGGGTAGSATITFATASFPAQVGASWTARMLEFFLPYGTGVLSAVDVAGTTTVTLNANFTRTVPAGTWMGFYREITLTTTATAAVGTSVLTFAATTGLATTPTWWCQEGPAFRNLSRVSALTATTVTLSRTLRAALPSGSPVTFRSDKFDDLYMPDECTFIAPSMEVERANLTDTVLLFKTEGSNSTFYDPVVVARPISGAATEYGLYLGGHKKGHYGNRILRPTLKGLMRIVNIEARGGAAVVDASNALLMSGTDASTVKDDPGIVVPAKYVLDGVREGLWTPVWVGLTTPGTNTYSVQNGTWYRSANRVFVRLQLRLTAFDSTGNMQIQGLPFAVAPGNSAAGVPAFATGITVSAGEVLMARALTTSTNIEFFRRTVTGTDGILNATALTAIARVDLTLDYATSEAF